MFSLPLSHFFVVTLVVVALSVTVSSEAAEVSPLVDDVGHHDNDLSPHSADAGVAAITTSRTQRVVSGKKAAQLSSTASFENPLKSFKWVDAGEVTKLDALNEKTKAWEVVERRVRFGYLTVPVDHADPKGPLGTASILFTVVYPLSKKISAKSPVIFWHCGGPGSGAECALSNGAFGASAPRSVVDDAYLVSVSQRGVTHAETLKALKDSISNIPSGVKTPPKDSPPAAVDNLDALSGIADHYSLSEVTEALNKRAKMSKQRYALKQYQLPQNRNWLEFMGTHDLAQDIELFRHSVGVEKFALFGFSYGTAVVSTYAAMFRSRVTRLIMSGVMPSRYTHFNINEGSARSKEETSEYFLRQCRLDSKCPIHAHPKRTMKALMAAARSSKGLKDPSTGEPITASALSQGMIPGGWQELAALYDSIRGVHKKGGKSKDKAASKLLASTTTATSKPKTNKPNQSGVETVGVEDPLADLRRHDQSNGGDKPEYSPWLQTAVYCNDLEGRPSKDMVLERYTIARKNYPFVGMQAWNAYSHMSFACQNEAKPLPPPSHPSVPTLVLNSLYDGATPYRDAAEMYNRFPNSSFISYQVSAHCPTLYSNKYRDGGEVVASAMKAFFKDGTLPPTGMVVEAVPHPVEWEKDE
jgi:pimeloyl-ACP methyl ester carboxylesterase